MEASWDYVRVVTEEDSNLVLHHESLKRPKENLFMFINHIIEN
jgi:hypothetical protein